jgi:hypothetical protein
MSHYLTNDDKYRDLLYGDDYREYLVARSKSAAGDKLGRMQGNRFRVHARNALGRAHGYLKIMIEAIANAKLRRLEREPELRGIRFDRLNDSW